MRFLIICLTTFFAIFSFAHIVSAQNPSSGGCSSFQESLSGGSTIKAMLKDCSGDNGVKIENTPTNSKGFQKKIISIANGALGFAALFAIGAIVYSGFLYVTAYGIDGRLQKAKSIGLFAVLGLILALTAFSLVEVVVKFIYSLG